MVGSLAPSAHEVLSDLADTRCVIATRSRLKDFLVFIVPLTKKEEEVVIPMVLRSHSDVLSGRNQLWPKPCLARTNFGSDGPILARKFLGRGRRSWCGHSQVVWIQVGRSRGSIPWSGWERRWPGIGAWVGSMWARSTRKGGVGPTRHGPGGAEQGASVKLHVSGRRHC